jgi:hypothetical protein
MKKLILLVLAAAALASCATFVAAPGEQAAEGLARFVNSTAPEALARASSAPFLVDQEIVSLSGDVGVFWKALKDGGVKLSSIAGAPPVAVTGETFRQFSPSFEMKVFFKKYVPGEARLYTLAAGGGKKFLLVAREEMLSRTIYGIKGPF